eukprot:3341871-Lingulodinium_polyedra.AAC.1
MAPRICINNAARGRTSRWPRSTRCAWTTRDCSDAVRLATLRLRLGLPVSGSLCACLRPLAPLGLRAPASVCA